jgi:catechol 2,3-dioxygenase-like lactoylglutathione lyase family enzyme
VAERRLAAVTLVVDDYDRAKRWFIDVLGFEAIEDTDIGGGKRWVTVAPERGGPLLLLARAATEHQRAHVGDQTGGRVGFFLETDDFRRDHTLYVGRGVRFLEDPRYEAYGTVAQFEDLWGNRWDLIERAKHRSPSTATPLTGHRADPTLRLPRQEPAHGPPRPHPSP